MGAWIEIISTHPQSVQGLSLLSWERGLKYLLACLLYTSLTRFAALKDIDLLVTDNGLSDDDYKKLRKAAIEVIKVELEISE